MIYYCHHCRRHINSDELLPEFACPGCRSGFVEELDSPPTQSNIIEDVLYDFITGVSMGSHLPGDLSSSSSTSSQTNATQPGSANSSFVSDRLLNLDFPAPFIQLNSNIGDYAWGNAGFDAIISQLLNNLDGSNTGPSPMPREQMEELPTFKICDEHINSNNSQCTVCLEDFRIGDTARKLPCDHYFHQECLIPWLKLHASCPVCRKTFVGQDTAEQQSETVPNTIDSQRPGSSGRRVYMARRSTSTGQGTSGNTSNTSSSNPNVNLKEEDCD